MKTQAISTDHHVFVVEDNPLYRIMLEEKISSLEGFKVSTFQDGDAVFETLKKGGKPDILVADYYYETGSLKNANALLKEIKAITREVPVVIMTSQGELKMAVQILKEGAFDVIAKDDDAFTRLDHALNKVSSLLKLKRELRAFEATKRKDLMRLAALGLVTLSCVGFMLWHA